TFDHFGNDPGGWVIYSSSTYPTFVDCRFIACKMGGINQGASQGLRVKNCTFDSCGIDISATTAYSCVFINNIHRLATTNCYKWTTPTPSNLYIRNHIGLNTKAVAWSGVDTLTAFQDHWQTSGDPLVTTPGSNYTLQAGSPCIDSAYSTKFGLQ
ncbi:MAG: hypothetical protein KKH61_20485, partial [Gammaproteobacteria bacterium]|nr:hypothetical protein [Gammaproteobacteria bacterium]